MSNPIKRKYARLLKSLKNTKVVETLNIVPEETTTVTELVKEELEVHKEKELSKEEVYKEVVEKVKKKKVKEEV